MILILDSIDEVRACTEEALRAGLPDETLVGFGSVERFEEALARAAPALVVIGPSVAHRLATETLALVRHHRPVCPAILFADEIAEATLAAWLDRSGAHWVPTEPAGATTLCAMARALVSQGRHQAGGRRQLFEEAPVGLYRRAPRGELLEVNRAFVDLLGYKDRRELIGLDILEVLGDSTDRSAWESRDGTRGEDGFEVRLRRADGSLLWVLQRSRAVVDRSGEVQYYEGMVQDLTDRGNAERRHLRSQKMEVVGRLAGGIAHEFNNLLMAILGECELLLDDPSNEALVRESLGEIQLAGRRAADLTRQLLTLSREHVTERSRVDLSDLLRTVRGAVSRVLGEAVELHLVTPAAPVPVEVDPDRLEQALVHLALNAKEAMPEGGQLVLSVDRVDIDQAGEAEDLGVSPGRYARLRVTDTGWGMDAETLARVFDPFFSTKRQQGAGLGLAIVDGVVRQSGGSIRAESEPGAGASFEILLPTVEVPEPSATEPERREAGSQRTVMVVEDQESVSRVATRFLRSAGYSVVNARDGEDALRRLGESSAPVDLLLTDVIMPNLGGPELVARLDDPDLPVIFMTGYTEDTRLLPEQLGPGTVLLAKPFTRAELMGAIARLLGP